MAENGDTRFTMGPFDIIVVLRNMMTGRFLAAVFEEKPPPDGMPDPGRPQTVRLSSRVQDDAGSATFDGALRELDVLATAFRVEPRNVVRDRFYPWIGRPNVVWLTGNWRLRAGRHVSDVLRFGEDPAAPGRASGG
jgi:hypothetical protein